MRRTVRSGLTLAALAVLAAGAAAAPRDDAPPTGVPGVGAPPIAVSPGAIEAFAPSPTHCPAYGWTLLPEATGYDLVVIELPPEWEESERISARDFALGDGTGTVFLRRQVPGGANSWLPPATQCLTPGRRYAWSVRAAFAAGWSAWTEPLLLAAPGRFVPVAPPTPPSGVARPEDPTARGREAVSACPPGGCASIRTSGFVESTVSGFRFPDLTVQKTAFTLQVFHAAVRADGLLQHGNVVSTAQGSTGIYSVNIGRDGKGCSATATVSLYDPVGVYIVPDGFATAVVDPGSSIVSIFTVDAAGLARSYNFMLHVICSPLILVGPV